MPITSSLHPLSREITIKNEVAPTSGATMIQMTHKTVAVAGILLFLSFNRAIKSRLIRAIQNAQMTIRICVFSVI